MTDSNENKNTKPQSSGSSGSLADMVGASVTLQPGAESVIDAGRVARMAILPVLAFAFLHWQLGWWLARMWQQNPNWSHGPLIPLFSAYLIYARWGRIEMIRPKISWTGFAIFITGLFFEAIFKFFGPLRNYSLYGLAMVMVVFGLVLYLSGWRLMKYLWLPVLFLVFAIPMSADAYTVIAYPLQKLAAFVSVGFFKLIGVQISQVESSITLLSQGGVEHNLTVAEACSGMNLLVAFVALAVAMAYLEEKPIWQRVVLVLAGVPIAVLCNVLRVIITCMMYYIDKPELGQGALHSITGMVMLVPAFGMLWGLSWLLKNIFVESDEDEDDQKAGDSANAEAAGE